MINKWHFKLCSVKIELSLTGRVIPMYLQEEELRELAKTDVLKNSAAKNFHNAAYDLQVKEIIWVDDDTRNAESHVLKAGESVFVATVETIDMPTDCIGQIIPRNSSIRMGLDIAAPVYQPGHKTRFFIRVTNMGSNEITLGKGMSIFSLMVYRLSHEVTHPYEGAFTDEFSFTEAAMTHSVKTAVAEATTQKEKAVQDVTKNIYATVLTLMSIFIALFSAIIINAKVIPDVHGRADLLFYNLVVLGSISGFVALASFLLDSVDSKIRGGLLVLCAACFLVSLYII